MTEPKADHIMMAMDLLMNPINSKLEYTMPYVRALMDRSTVAERQAIQFLIDHRELLLDDIPGD